MNSHTIHKVLFGLLGLTGGLTVGVISRHKPENRAIAFVHTIDTRVVCADWGTDSAGDSTAMCTNDGNTFYCVAGPDAKPKCEAVASKAPPAQAPAPAPAPAPAK